MEYVKRLDINPLFLKFRSIHPSMNMMWLLFSAKLAVKTKPPLSERTVYS